MYHKQLPPKIERPSDSLAGRGGRPQLPTVAAGRGNVTTSELRYASTAAQNSEHVAVCSQVSIGACEPGRNCDLRAHPSAVRATVVPRRGCRILGDAGSDAQSSATTAHAGHAPGRCRRPYGDWPPCRQHWPGCVLPCCAVPVMLQRRPKCRRSRAQQPLHRADQKQLHNTPARSTFPATPRTPYSASGWRLCPRKAPPPLPNLSQRRPNTCPCGWPSLLLSKARNEPIIAVGGPILLETNRLYRHSAFLGIARPPCKTATPHSKPLAIGNQAQGMALRSAAGAAGRAPGALIARCGC